MRHSTNLLALAAIAALPLSALAQEVCAITTVTVTVEPTPEAVETSLLATDTPSVPASSVLSPVDSSASTVVIPAETSAEPCSPTTSTTTITSRTTVTVTPTPATKSKACSKKTEASLASMVPESSSVAAVETTSMAASSTPVAASSAASTSLVLSDFVFVSQADVGSSSTATPMSSVATSSPVMSSQATSSTAASSSSAAAAAAAASGAVALGSSLSGQATFYGGNVAGGTCSFTGYTIPSGIFGTALSESNWGSAGNCGACIQVTGPSKNTITAMIVDECPGCGTNHLDLFPNAFSELANPTTGIIDVSWKIVECGITTPITLHNKDGTSAYWFSMQVVNSNIPVSKLEVSTDGSNWTETTRQDYNFFEYSSGFGTDTVSVRITSSTGKTITVDDVSVSSGTSMSAGSNF